NIKVLLNARAKNEVPDHTPRGTPVALPAPPPAATRVLVSSIGTALSPEELELAVDHEAPQRSRSAARPSPGSYSRALEVDRGRVRRALAAGLAAGLALGIGGGVALDSMHGPTL